ncbi:TatD family hydrolase [Nocardioides acrostichi]|uniref:TatD family hydrolase n=1 Tax=Nocardioides acrostichi TaxID=2784339 RepID=A0A930UZP9_9ACTN|nr:TatD family hydrolase [Nocardioides acrostichi]MBF4161025.1 TatD family hydrolase [Nocardioides acrostichi]
MTLIDTHAHLDAAGGIPALDDDRATPGDDLNRIVAVTNLPRHYERLHGLQHPRVQWALGLHPGQPHPSEVVTQFLDLLPTCAVVGEVGLDGTVTGPNAVPLHRQRDELDQILTHPETAKRLVSLHSRRAVKETIDHLRRALIPGAVLHWFTGTAKQAQAAADHGAYFSVNARMTRKSELLAAIPRDRVLLETDAPYTGKASRPGDLNAVINGLADAWNVTTTAAEDTIITNQDSLLAALQVRPFE